MSPSDARASLPAQSLSVASASTTAGLSDPCDGMPSQHVVADLTPKHDGIVHLRCGSWNGKSGWGFRKIEGKHFRLHGLNGPFNLNLVRVTLNDPRDYRVEPTRDPGVFHAVYEEKMATCFCGAMVVLRVVVKQSTGNIITAYKMPFHDH